MKKNLALLGALALGAALSPLVAARAAAPAPRQHILMDADWRFHQDAPVVLRDSTAVTAWRWRVGEPGEEAAMTAAALGTTGGDWKDAATGDDVFHGRQGFTWFRTTLPALTAARGRTLRFEGVDDNATVYLNGQKLSHHEGWNDPFEVPLDAAWNAAGPNALAVLVENTAGGGGVTAPVSLGVSSAPVGGADPSRPGMSDATWRTVHLPHDYVVESAFTPKGDPSHGSLIPTDAWYRKTFTLPASDKGKSLWLNFDGAYRDSKVYLNGVLLGEHPCGYTPFNLDISQAAHYGGRNVLAVQTNAQKSEGWWYEGGGIYRHVWLNIADPVHVAPWGTFVSTKMAEPGPDGVAGPATVNVKTTVDYPMDFNGNPAFTLISRVIDPAGKVVGTATAPADDQAGQRQVTQRITVERPTLWSVETPRLYTLHTEIVHAGNVVDATDTPFGIRTIRFDAEQGFFLNGRPVKIKGTCNHQDFAGVGVAMPDSLLYWRVKKLKEMGSNAYRMSHNPPTAELLDACDTLGMLVMDENRHLGDTESGKASQDTPYADLHEVQSMVLRDRNHPSVIMWSMCNEEGIQSTPHGRDIFAAMKKAVDAVDGTRPVTCAMNGGYDSAVGITSVEDLQGINYNSGGYDGFHKAHPAMPLYGSETSSEVGTRGVYTATKFDNYQGDPARGFVSAYDINAVPWGQTAEEGWQTIADRPFVAGGYVWTGFDYKGEPTPFGWPDINSNFGIMDECGFPKDAYYYYQSWWCDQPIVHVFPHWNWPGQEGKPIDVWVHSNAVKVKLTLNNVSLGVKNMPRNGHLQWTVPYAPGRLTATGYDANGKILATDAVETTGVPIQIKLRPDRVTMNADGEDVILITAAFLDAKGRVVPYANGNVTFTANGAGVVVGVGNGDPSDHDPDRAAHRKAFHGLCLAVVQAKERGGKITFTANAPGLKSAVVTLNAK